jgi:hypothetical protein
LTRAAAMALSLVVAGLLSGCDGRRPVYLGMKGGPIASPNCDASTPATSPDGFIETEAGARAVAAGLVADRHGDASKIGLGFRSVYRLEYKGRYLAVQSWIKPPPGRVIYGGGFDFYLDRCSGEISHVEVIE